MCVCVCAVFKVLDELKFKHYHSQTDKYLQLFHHRPVAAALYKKVCHLKKSIMVQISAS